MSEAIPLSEHEIKEALDIARDLVQHGVPVFAAAPCPAAHGGTCEVPGHANGKEEFHRPAAWQQIGPSLAQLERWRPGWALAMVGGHVADVLDVDPRAGGDASAAELKAAGQWPRTFGTQSTPSGGEHHVISATGERETNGFMPGLDLQSGAAQPDERGSHGRAYAWISPTVKRSKVTGQLAPYRWIERPDIEALTDFAGADDSVEGIRTRVAARQAARAPRTDERSAGQGVRGGGAEGSENPFVTASESQLFGGQGGRPDGPREFTPDEARAYVEPVLARLRAARIGEIEERCNAAAATLYHFVGPGLLTVDGGMQLLREALAHTAYDPAHPASAWTVEKFVPVLDGRRPPLDGWKATARVAPSPSRALEQNGPPPADAVDALLAEMLTLTEVRELPPPRPLIKGLLNLDSEAWIIGAPGCRKSFVALDMACRVALGMPWQGLDAPAAHGVVLIAAEGAGGLGNRVRAWEVRHGALPDGVRVLPRPVQAADRAAWAVLVEACRRLAPGLVVVDTQARSTVGLDENDARDMGLYVDAVGAIKRATGACVLSIHHTGRKGGDARGSSAIDGAQDTELKVEKGEGLRGRLLVEKQKDLDERAPLDLAFEVVQVGVDEKGVPITSLVLAADPFAVESSAPLADASAREESDLRTALHATAEWERGYGPMQVQIMRVLLHVGGSVGLTKAECFASVLQNFYPDGTARTKGSSFRTAWTRVLELRDRSGEPVAVNVRGEKWVVNEDTLADLPPGGYAPPLPSASEVGGLPSDG